VGLQKLPTYEILYKMIQHVNSPIGVFNLLESSPCIESIEKWYPKYGPFGLHCQMSPCCHLVTNYTWVDSSQNCAGVLLRSSHTDSENNHRDS
jgi:hypothetical protein